MGTVSAGCMTVASTSCGAIATWARRSPSDTRPATSADSSCRYLSQHQESADAARNARRAATCFRWHESGGRVDNERRTSSGLTVDRDLAVTFNRADDDGCELRAARAAPLLEPRVA